jgi:hypothetical protein
MALLPLFLGLCSGLVYPQLLVDETFTASQVGQNIHLESGVQASNVLVPLGMAKASGDCQFTVGPDSSGSAKQGVGNYGVSDPNLELLSFFSTNESAVAIVACDTIACPEDPLEPCLYLASDTIVCSGGASYYTFTACNPSTASFDVETIVLDVLGPPGVTLSPSSFNLGTPLAADGSCQSFTAVIGGPVSGGSTLCFHLVGHSENPVQNPGALCCSLDEVCVDIPNCDPCAGTELGIEAVQDSSDCCYQLQGYNGFSPTAFDAIHVEVISPATAISSIDNPVGSLWAVGAVTATEFTIVPALTQQIGTGTLMDLPTFCLETSLSPDQQVVLSWIENGLPLCSDTLSVSCDPPCGYFTNAGFYCIDGEVHFSGTVHNGSPNVVEVVVAAFDDPALQIYDVAIPVPPLQPGDDYGPIDVVFGAPALAGEEVCITFVLHEISPSGVYLSCCDFTYCDIVPACGTNEVCLCEPDFDQALAAGLSFALGANNPLLVFVDFVDNELMKSCDMASWNWNDGTSSVTYGPASGTSHIYADPGTYLVCAKLVRNGTDGTQCKGIVCDMVPIPIGPDGGQVKSIDVSPNPTDGLCSVLFHESSELPCSISVFSSDGRLVCEQAPVTMTEGVAVDVDLRNEPAGVYVVLVRSGTKFFQSQVLVR